MPLPCLRQLLLFLLALSACSAPGPANAPQALTHVVTIFAAASLTDAFGALGADFEAAHPNVNLRFNFGGSQNLRTQLEHGASADIFASANPREMTAVVEAGLAAADGVRSFLTNQLVVVLPAANPAQVHTLSDLARPGLKMILAAPEVPVGAYAYQALDNLTQLYGPTFKTDVLANIVSLEDNVKQVVAKVQLGEADAGIVYRSDAVAAPDLKTLDIPPAANVIAEYPIVVLKAAAEPALAQAWVDYVLSPAGQATLARWGFTPTAP